VKFLYALDIDQGYLVHTPTGTRSPQKNLIMLGGVAVGRRIRDREVASSITGCSAARCNSGQVVHTRVPLFTKQYKLVPASAGE